MINNRLRNWQIALLTMAALTFASVTRADVASAQKALDDAKSSIANADWTTADTNAKLAEVELDGVADAEKKPIQDQIDAIKKQIADSKVNAGKAQAVEHAEGLLSDAKKLLTEHPDPSGVLRDADELDEFLNKDDTKAAIPADQIAKYRAQMAKYKTVASASQGENEIESVSREYDRLHEDFDSKMSEIKSGGEPGAHDHDIDVLGRDLEILHNHLTPLPQDNDKVKTMQASWTQMNTAFEAVNNSNQATAVLRALKDNWDSYADEYKGWEGENISPTFERYSKESSVTMSAFQMPKTKALINVSDQFLSGLKDNKDYAAVASAPEIKALVDGITKLHDQAYAKMLKDVTSVVEGAEKSSINGNNKTALYELNVGIGQALGDKSPETAPLQARVSKLDSAFAAATAGAEQAKLDAYKQLKEKATTDWPAMEAKFSPVSGFDPNNYKSFAGKQVKITTDNLMGFRFQPGDFPFATTMNGVPIACKYAPAVKNAINDVEKQIGRGIGDSDDDGRWQIIAVVDGTMGKLMSRKQLEGDINSESGGKVGTYKSEYSEPVDAPILTIVAAHCGPLAVAANSSQVAAARASGSAASWLHLILLLIIGLAAATAALLKAGFAPLVSVPRVGQVHSRLGSTNLALIGLVCAAFGVIWLLLGYIVFGLLVNLAIIAAGSYAALDWLVDRGIIKPDLAAKIRPLGVPIGLACATLVLLEMVVHGRLYIL